MFEVHPIGTESLLRRLGYSLDRLRSAWRPVGWEQSPPVDARPMSGEEVRYRRYEGMSIHAFGRLDVNRARLRALAGD